MSEQKFHQGDRVRVSGLYIAQCAPNCDRNKLARKGTIRSIQPNDECYWVVWDGRRSASGYHQDFLEVAE